MKRDLIFIRHAESVSNAGGLTVPHSEIPLSGLGQRQAAVLAEILPARPTHIVMSPMIRTHQTAAPYVARVSVVPEIAPELGEFSIVGHALIDGMNGSTRKAVVKPYWDDPNPERRMGEGADTFREFEARVAAYQSQMPNLATGTVVFGHGIWFGLLAWRLLGHSVTDPASMQAFRRFQIGLPMPNCAVHHLSLEEGKPWRVCADLDIRDRISGVV